MFIIKVYVSGCRVKEDIPKPQFVGAGFLRVFQGNNANRNYAHLLIVKKRKKKEH